MEGVREPLRTGTLLGVHNTCGSRVRFFSHAFDVHWLLASARRRISYAEYEGQATQAAS